MQYQATGSVIPPGGKVASIVPNDSDKVARVRILSKDIGFVEKEQEAEVKIIPYDPSIYGTIKGQIKSVSGSSSQDPKDNLFYYLSDVKLANQEIKKGERSYALQAGMPVEVEILGDKTNLLSYIIIPLTRSFR